MKKQIILIFFVVVFFGGLSLVSCDDYDFHYRIYVNGANSHYGSKVEYPKYATENETVTIVAKPGKGYSFGRWIVEHGDVTLDKTANPVTFNMPAEDIILGVEFDYVFLSPLITDRVFNEYCKQFDTNEDYVLSQQEAEAVTSIDIESLRDKESLQFLKSLAGIELFTNLEELNCSYNNLSALDVSKNTKLTTLFCIGNNLSNLDVRTNILLKELWCDHNNLSFLDIRQNTVLENLSCAGNNLSDLNVSNNLDLKFLDCGSNNISILNLNLNVNLKLLYCYFNNFSANAIMEIFAALPMRNAEDDAIIYCGGNPGSGEITEADRKVAEDKNWTVYH